MQIDADKLVAEINVLKSEYLEKANNPGSEKFHRTRVAELNGVLQLIANILDDNIEITEVVTCEITSIYNMSILRGKLLDDKVKIAEAIKEALFKHGCIVDDVNVTKRQVFVLDKN